MAAEISDEEWDEGSSIDDDDAEPLPLATYEDFEAALAATGAGASAKKKDKKAAGAVRLSLGDAPKRPKPAQAPVELAGKPAPRPGAVEAAQPASPPPPPALAGPPKPRQQQQQPEMPSKPATVKKPAPLPTPALERPAAKAPAAPTAETRPQQQKQAEKPAVVAKKEQLPPQPAAKPKPAAAVVEPRAPAPQPPAKAPAAAVAAEVRPTQPPEPKKAPVAPAQAQAPQAPVKPAPAAAAKPPAFEKSPEWTPEEREAARVARRERGVAAAAALRASGASTEVSVWQVNAAGLLVSSADGGDISGFIPLTELSQPHATAVLAEERRLVEAGGAPAEGPALRRAAMAILRDQRFIVEVVAIDEADGRVILSERAAKRTAAARMTSAPPSAEVLAAAAAMIGQVIPARVRTVRPFGVFLDFTLPLGDSEASAFGLVHSSELSWDEPAPGARVVYPLPPGASKARAAEAAAAAAADFTPGQVVQARLTYVDPTKARIFLSIRRATPNPLLETLDSLLASARGSGGAMVGGDAPAVGGPRQTVDASVDMRPLLGDLDVAVSFAESIVEAEGVVSASPGVRLEGRASSQSVEVYMAKESAETGDTDGENSGAPKKYTLVLRRGRDVQEVEVVATLDRAALRDLAAATVASLGEAQ